MLVGKVTRNVAQKWGGKKITKAAQKTSQSVFQAAQTTVTTHHKKTFVQKIKQVLRNTLALGCKKKPVRDAYGEVYNAIQKGNKASKQINQTGAKGWITKKGVWGWNFAKEIGPLPILSYFGGLIIIPVPGAGDAMLLASLMGKKAIKKVVQKSANKIGQFLTIVK